MIWRAACALFLLPIRHWRQADSVKQTEYDPEDEFEEEPRRRRGCLRPAGCLAAVALLCAATVGGAWLYSGHRRGEAPWQDGKIGDYLRRHALQRSKQSERSERSEGPGWSERWESQRESLRRSVKEIQEQWEEVANPEALRERLEKIHSQLIAQRDCVGAGAREKWEEAIAQSEALIERTRDMTRELPRKWEELQALARLIHRLGGLLGPAKSGGEKTSETAAARGEGKIEKLEADEGAGDMDLPAEAPPSRDYRIGVPEGPD